ncbi:MAG: hypothetical protein JXR91_01660 [Deltaproteobacteria bacterium]|nr:hypothetical protein [Deltaproteobacteria bacterium]
MEELSIIVNIENEKKLTYKFEKLPIVIGRDEDCDLSICHSAVPRKLCTVWIDREEGKISLEENPTLTNPLINENSIVSGGITRDELHLKVGPVFIEIYNSEKQIDFKRVNKGLWTFDAVNSKVLISLAAMLLASAVLLSSGTDAFSKKNSLKLPELDVNREKTPGACQENKDAGRGTLMILRGRELLKRKPLTVDVQFKVLSLLEGGLDCFKGNDINKYKEISEDITRIKQNLNNSYKVLKLSVLENIEAENIEGTKTAAQNILHYINKKNDPELFKKLTVLAKNGEL